MFVTPISYPCAVSDQSDEGLETALRWVVDHMEEGQHLTVWVSQKSVLTANSFVRDLTSEPGVQVAVGRGGGYFHANGPVLALYAHADDLGKITSSRGITALCVVQWADRLQTWVRETGASVLHELDLDPADRELFGIKEAVDLPPQVVEELEALTRVINHNNTIRAGFEKTVVVRGLLRLHDTGVPLPAQEMKEWAAAHGWRGENPAHLADYATRISQGTRPRIR